MTQEALAQTQEPPPWWPAVENILKEYGLQAIDFVADFKQALEQTQEPVAYDKTEMNCFVQDLYDKKMKEGKHGHYETMFHVVHQAIKRVPPQRSESSGKPSAWVGLTDEDICTFSMWLDDKSDVAVFTAIEAKLKEKNT